MSVPAIVLRLALESGRVAISLEGIDSRQDAARLGDWIATDRRRHSLLVNALELAQQPLGDLEDDELLARLADVPASPGDPYATLIPLGSFQSKPLRYVLEQVDQVKCSAWFAWALARDWEARDAAFVAALRRVAVAEFCGDTPTPPGESAGSDT